VIEEVAGVDEPAGLAIRLSGVRKRFGAVEALRGIDLAVRPGEIVAYLGPNGAGKTTTVDLVLGLSRPSAGSVEVFGMAPEQAVRKGLVAAVMQNGGLLKDLTVLETVRYVAALYPYGASVSAALERAGIGGIANRMVGKCSGGEQQRVRFAMALLADPDLLVLDEPTQAMDVEGRRDFWAAIREDTASGRTILFATHYLDEADSYADRVVLIRQGELVADGTPAQVKALAAGRTVRATLPGADAVTLRRVPGVDDVEIRGETVLLHCSDSDAAARYLLTETGAHDLEITTRALEDAFLALTADEPIGAER